MDRSRIGGLLFVAASLAACSPRPVSTFLAAPGQEQMPAPASVWLTADPVTPAKPVKVDMTAPGEPEFHREHAFVAGEALRGSFPVSSGRYRITGLDGACTIDLFLGPERETDVVIRLDDADGCQIVVEAEHGYGKVTHEEPDVLVAP